MDSDDAAEAELCAEERDGEDELVGAAGYNADEAPGDIAGDGGVDSKDDTVDEPAAHKPVAEARKQ